MNVWVFVFWVGGYSEVHNKASLGFDLGEQVFCELPRPEYLDVVLVKDDGLGVRQTLQLHLIHKPVLSHERRLDGFQFLPLQREVLELLNPDFEVHRRSPADHLLQRIFGGLFVMGMFYELLC